MGGASDVRTADVAILDDSAQRHRTMVRGSCRDLRSAADDLRLHRPRARPVAYAVGLYITAAYWFTASTSFANPAVTIARALSDTFAGIAPGNVSAFIVAQIFGMLAAVALGRWMWPVERVAPATMRAA